MMAYMANKEENIPAYFITGIGSIKNHNPENIVIIPNAYIIIFGIFAIFDNIRTNGPENKTKNNIIDTSKARLAINYHPRENSNHHFLHPHPHLLEPMFDLHNYQYPRHLLLA